MDIFTTGVLQRVVAELPAPAPFVLNSFFRTEQRETSEEIHFDIDTGKRRRLVHAAQRFLQDHPALADAPCRFDVVDAQGDPASPRLDWIRDAFRADEV